MDGILIEVKLSPTEIAASGKDIARDLQRSVESGVEGFKDVGRKIGNALSAGLSDAVERAREIQQKLDGILSPDRRIASIQAKEIAHQNKLNEIATRGAEQLAVIEARKDQQLAAIHAKAEADEERHQQRLAEIQQRNQGSLGQNLSRVGTALTVGVTAPIVAAGTSAVNQAIQLDSTTRALTAISGSAQEAQKQLVRLREIAKLPGIDFQGAVQGSVRLQAVGLSAAQAERALKSFANAVSLTGGGAEQLNSITVQLSQLSSKGKVLAQDLRPIIEAAPAVARALKAAFGTVDSESISANLAAAGKSTKDFVNILLTELEKIPQVTAGPREAFDNFRITVGLAMAKVGDAVVRLLVPALAAAGDFIEKFADKFSALSAPAQTFIIAIIGVAAAIGPLLLLGGKLIESFALIKTAWLALSAIFEGGAIAALPALFSPVGLAIAAVVAVLGIAAVAWINYESAADRAAKVSVESITAAQGQIDSLKRTQTEVASLTTAQLASAEGHSKLKAAIDSLDPGTRAYINSLSNEQSKLNEVNRVLAEQIKLKQDLLNQNLADVGAAASSNAVQIEQLEKRKQALKELSEITDKLRQDNLDGQTFQIRFQKAALELTGNTLGPQRREAADAVKALGDAITETATKTDAAKNAQAAFGAEVAKYLELNHLTIEGFVQQQTQLGASKSSIEGNVNAFRAFESQQAAAAAAAAKAAGEINAEAKATDNLAAALGRLSLGGANKVISDTLARIAVQSKDIADARRRVAEARAKDDDFFFAEQLTKRVTPIQAAISKDFDFSPKTGGGGTSRVESQQRALREAQLRFDKDTLAQQERLVKDAADRELRLLEENFRAQSDARKQSLQDQSAAIAQFYDDKFGLIQANIGNEVNLIQREIAATEAAAAAAKASTPERIRLEEQLLKLRTDLEIKTRALMDAERQRQTESIKALEEEGQRLFAITKSLSLATPQKVGELPSEAIKASVSPVEEAAREAARQSREVATAARVSDLNLQQQELQVQRAINAGTLTEAEGRGAILAFQRQSRDVQIQALELAKQGELNPEKLARINLEIEKLRGLGAELTPAAAFFKGLRSEAETTAEAFERIGTRFKDTFFNVVDTGIDKLTKRFGIFKDLIGDVIKLLARQFFTRLLGGGGGNNSGGSSGGLGSIFNAILGGGGNAQPQGSFNLGSIANILTGNGNRNSASLASFLTPAFNPAASGGSGGALSLASFFGGGSGGGGLAALLNSPLSAPPSVSSGGAFGFSGQLLNTLSNAGRTQQQGGLAGLLSKITGGNGQQGFLGKILGGLTGGGAVSLLPALLGAGLGASLGGQSGLGQILGGLGGSAVGLGVAFGASVFSAGGGLAAASLAALGPAALIGAPLLVAAFLLGRAKQRRQDESTSGDALQQAVDSIHDLRDQIKNDQVQLSADQARKVLESDILQPFIAVINQLKTRSVRESRLAHQVPDLRNLFEREILPEIEAQKIRIRTGKTAGSFRNIVPEFAQSGVVPGVYRGFDDVHVMAHPGEMFLNRQHQAMIAALAGGDIFRKVGVPDAPAFSAQGVQTFANSGTVVQSLITPSGGNSGPIEITIESFEMNITEEQAGKIVFKGVRTSTGQGAIFKTVKDGRKAKEF